MLFGEGRAAEFFKFAVVLGQLNRALYIEAAADFQKGLFDVVVFDFDRLLPVDAMID